MMKLSVTDSADQRCALQLVESDRRYFEMAALVEDLSVGQLAWMPGLTDLAASCVVQRIESAKIKRNPVPWLDEVETELAERRVSIARLYFDDADGEIDAALRDRGYVRRAEIGYLAPLGPPPSVTNLTLSAITTDSDWDQKLSLHEEAMEGPDGYTNQADLWVEMEARKCCTGQMESYLVRRDQQVVATVGAIVHDGFLRLKNILVSPRFRRCGIGLATVHLLWQLADSQSDCRFGVYAVEGAKGSRMYQRAGLHVVTCQYEWSRIILDPSS